MSKCIFKVSLNVYMFEFLWYTIPAFWSNIKLEQLQVTVLKRSRDLSKANNTCKLTFSAVVQMYFQSTSECIICFRTRYTIHAFWSNIKLEQLQITVLKWSRELSKTGSFFKRHIQNYCPNIFSKFLWLLHRFCGLWYTLPLCFMEYWTKLWQM